MGKRDESGIKLKDIKTYNKKYHFNHKKDWTSLELNYILNTNDTFVTMSLSLGRTASTISMKRSTLGREKHLKLKGE